MTSKPKKAKKPGIYESILEKIFVDKYQEGDTSVPFERHEIQDAAQQLNLAVPKNLGDVLYSFRYRQKLPSAITNTAPSGYEWMIRTPRRAASYSFELSKSSPRILPSEGLVLTKIPDSTPEIVIQNALGDEQALLAIVRYNRLVDVFLGISAYSLQNHLRTTIRKGVQSETDEVYVGVDSRGVQYVCPVQAKGGKDVIGIVQVEQDLEVCREKFSSLVPRPVAVQFIDQRTVAMFELGIQDGCLVRIRESHYRLVAGSDITADDLAMYRRQAAMSDGISK